MKNYFIILTFLLLPFMTAQAQNGGIIYTCFYPDTCKVVHYPDSMAFDVDYDGVLDFWFNGGVEIGALIPRIVVNDGWEFCIVKDSVELTNDTLLWCDNDSYSQWWNAYNMRYGFRKTIEGKYYYAWTEATVDYYETPWNQTKLFCESGMAFCTIPNYPLRWGQTNFIGIEETEANAFASVHPNPTNGMVTIKGDNLHQTQVVNILGQQVFSMQCKGNELQIDMTGLPAGIYFVNITDELGRKCVHKVVKE